MNLIKNLLVCLFSSYIAFSAYAKIKLAVTVDDIPSSGISVKNINREKIARNFVKQFKKYRVPEVYGFLNGVQAENMLSRIKILQLWKSSGHLIGNHTYSHLSLSATSYHNYIKDIERNESILIDFADSINELKAFRFPYLQEGENKEKRYAIRSYLNKRKYRIAQVTVDFRDWLWLEPYARCIELNSSKELEFIKNSYINHAKESLLHANALAQRVWGNRPMPHILLIHINASTSAFLADLLKEFKNLDVQFVSSKTHIFDKFFDEDTTYMHKEGKDFIHQSLETRKLSFPGLKTPLPPIEKLKNICT